jgi:hypothetical protein
MYIIILRKLNIYSTPSTNKSDPQDITEILLKVVYNTIILTLLHKLHLLIFSFEQQFTETMRMMLQGTKPSQEECMVLNKYMKLLRNDVSNLSHNMYVLSKIYWKFNDGIVYSNERCLY